MYNVQRTIVHCTMYNSQHVQFLRLNKYLMVYECGLISYRYRAEIVVLLQKGCHNSLFHPRVIIR